MATLAAPLAALISEALHMEALYKPDSSRPRSAVTLRRGWEGLDITNIAMLNHSVQPQGGRSRHPPHFTPKVSHFTDSMNMLHGVNNEGNYSG